jgi:ubiquinone/menaquinone biosynthesis C-methylase UbiE
VARYIPALRFDALTRFFDPVVRVTTRERRFKQLLVEQMALATGQRVLDIGCGTATLAIEIANACSGLDVHGVDGDPRVLEIARAKVVRHAVAVTLHEALAWELPFAEATFDRVVSSLVFHHLDADGKRGTLSAIHRVLRPGGELHVADWGRAHGPAMRAAFLIVQALDGFATTRDSVRGLLPEMMRDAGFSSVDETRRLRTPLGTLALYRARRD